MRGCPLTLALGGAPRGSIASRGALGDWFPQCNTHPLHHDGAPWLPRSRMAAHKLLCKLNHGSAGSASRTGEERHRALALYQLAVRGRGCRVAGTVQHLAVGVGGDRRHRVAYGGVNDCARVHVVLCEQAAVTRAAISPGVGMAIRTDIVIVVGRATPGSIVLVSAPDCGGFEGNWGSGKHGVAGSKFPDCVYAVLSVFQSGRGRRA
ncbi:hypothetical protein FB451DRAFT_1184960 [Mycena latifolia]|nr:hypothetical protein FB451DRAFT_1184960 [Mycena latifolia]